MVRREERIVVDFGNDEFGRWKYREVQWGAEVEVEIEERRRQREDGVSNAQLCGRLPLDEMLAVSRTGVLLWLEYKRFLS